MSTEQKKKTADQTLTGGRDAAGELTEGELEQVSGGGRTVQTPAAALSRPCRGTESN